MDSEGPQPLTNSAHVWVIWTVCLFPRVKCPAEHPRQWQRSVTPTSFLSRGVCECKQSFMQMVHLLILFYELSRISVVTGHSWMWIHRMCQDSTLSAPNETFLTVHSASTSTLTMHSAGTSLPQLCSIIRYHVWFVSNVQMSHQHVFPLTKH